MALYLDGKSLTAGELFHNHRFLIPQYQREYAWGKAEVEEFMRDLAGALTEDYFIGLIILAGEDDEKEVVDGQQRLVTITLLAHHLVNLAVRSERHALATRLDSTFLREIDYTSDEERPRLRLSSTSDNSALLHILGVDHETTLNVAQQGGTPNKEVINTSDLDTAANLLEASSAIRTFLENDLGEDTFKRLGAWAEFLTNRLYIARFILPDVNAAYRTFETINARGKNLTTADLLKSYVLSQAPDGSEDDFYSRWLMLQADLGDAKRNTLVQFIRHAFTLQRGYVLPRDLYDELTGRGTKNPALPGADVLKMLENEIDVYRQINNPNLSGPSSDLSLRVFHILSRLNVQGVRPILLAISHQKDAEEGYKQVLRLVVTRMTVGNLGTGAIDRRFGETAKRIVEMNSWREPLTELQNELMPDREKFFQAVRDRSMNRNLLELLRASALSGEIAPVLSNTLHLVKPKNGDWGSADQQSVSRWVNTIGNTVFATASRRPNGTSDWNTFLEDFLPLAEEAGEDVQRFRTYESWVSDAGFWYRCSGDPVLLCSG
ncbi:Uncharacterized conserved protein, contains ParB-like and HNH nuclease domains [Corynebacterium coyleae]|uniref:DUF262 domain-containing protein n=1 Tax=Corynebacterium coyleae TaxID=53374 RepID=A0ABX8KY37_9CORY|nr:DUF262 domain-containing protein [Corynebacterium coyleae]QXB18795.1 DUF262 domain-containing protein [Corynebacterium coyleae]WJY80338.1 hypothetical protein CCOY_08735 [Corynebacterium coyleae]SEB41299.1 Uncharacterized conserved protein, contains ParB-like and HNH nuclease domains [Corynebacterium coyleae]